MKRALTVSDGAAAARLDVYLAAELGQTRSQTQRLLRAGLVTVNHEPQRPSYSVQAGDTIEVEEAPVVQATVTIPNLLIVYEDDDILVIDKPAGLAAHAGSGSTGKATVVDFARGHTADPDPDRPGIVHRLDLDTSGLMVIAKTPAAKTFMQDQFRAHTIRKTYTLLVIGRVKPPEAVIRLPLDRDPSNPLRRAVVAGGREAVTRYRTTRDYPGFSLIEASPETGRTHQLRVHFAAIGHPVAGDTTYGSPVRLLGLRRQFLHAAAIEFVAPSGQTMRLESLLPPDLAKVVQALEERL